MLSSKLQKDLIDAYQAVYEAKRGHAAGDSDVEKQASQLASDVRYKAKGKIKPGASEEEKKKVYIQILGASPAPNAVKSMAKQKLIGEETEKTKMYRKAGNLSREAISAGSNTKKGQEKMKEVNKITKQLNKEAKESKVEPPREKLKTDRDMFQIPKKDRDDAKSRLLAKAAKKRAKMQTNSHEPQGEVVSEMGGMKMKQVVKPKPVTQNPKDMSKKITDKAPVDYRMLAQSYEPVGNIFKEFKMTPKKNKKPGKSMDPVGQEDGDINNDGKKDGTDKYLANRRKAIGKAIAKKRGRVKEGFSAWRIDLDFNESVKK